ncbi:hypothetical protein E9549_18435 [Blastococcus sp. MG754426]|uniref:hypothetical protein n=1 Tax=unclassified Blastococcus TaxID=2619396 RepID=UPI001EEFD542|nr:MULTISPECIES: hypothetical protein [unclassified Blastococcus]MCF6509365.1 hypothetical protein [Blastococcus sp. MG754426]MCF6513877.1 hypothetical protein [Blastococcus sp. MG754427]
MLKEVAVERYRFTCAGCGHTWSADYDVQHVEDGHGLTWEYYALNGIPVPAPTAPGSLMCPRCGATWIHFQLAAVRSVPLAEPADGQTDPDRPRQRLDPERQAARRQAPLLSGEQLVFSDSVFGVPSAEP